MTQISRIGSKSRRFDERGNVAMIFALMSTAAFALLGATIELGRISSAKASLNAAADAAALAAKRAQMENEALGDAEAKRKGEAVGQKIFEASKPSADKGVTSAQVDIVWDADGSARALATGDMDLLLGRLIGRPTMDINTHGVATAGSDKFLEVALVIDTTASMFATDSRADTRFTKTRDAAKNFVNTLFDTVNVPERLRVAVVPWTTTVNIKSETPLPWSAAPAPRRTVPDYGTRELPQATIDRSRNLRQNAASLQSLFAPVEWRGCVGGATETAAVSDAPVSSMRWDALQVPPLNRQATTTQARQVPSVCQREEGCSPPPPPPPGGTQGNFINPLKQRESFAFLEFGKSMQQAACVRTNYPCLIKQCDAASRKVTGLDCWQASDNGTSNGFFNFTGDRACRFGGCLLDLNPRVATGCTADYNEVKYNARGGEWCYFVTKSEWTSFKPIAGPNLNCPMPMLGLSANRKQVIDTIDRLSPAPGGTHADVGLRWGLRALSPRREWSNFFGYNAPKAFGTSQASKIMVLLTDGSNEEAFDYPGYYGCSDLSAPGCTKTAATKEDRAKLDTKMKAWCREIRLTYKVELYTIAVNVTDQRAIDLLEECVGGDPNRSYSVDADELDATFTAIARSTFGLRIKE